MTKPLCIYHAHCADGFAAAWAVRQALGAEHVDFHAADYQDPPPEVAGCDVIMVDFSYKRPVLQRMARTARSILVLDHHKSAQEDLAGLGIGAEIREYTWQWWIEQVVPEMIEENREQRIGVLFDTERSGAGLTWDFFHDAARPPLIDHVEDRDLWRFRLDNTREIMAAVMSYPYDFEEWSSLMRAPLECLYVSGLPILRQKAKDIGEAIDQTMRHMVIGGHRVPVANVPKAWASDAGNILAEGNPFAATYFDGPKGRAFSLRSIAPDGLDVRKIAESYGGGGHPPAAGFRVPIGWEGDQ
jgi:hypothetical protein